MKKETYYVVTFESTNHAIKGEKLLKELGVDFKTIPTPREITSSCGLSIRFDLRLLNTVKSIVEDDKLSIKGIYKINKEGNKRTAEEIK